MLEFLAKRLAQVLPTLLFVSMLIFGLQQLLPGDPAKILAGEDQDPNVVAYLRTKLHLDEPLPVRYAYWVGGVLRGDLGESLRTQQQVLELVLQKLPVTIELAGMAMLIALIIGIPAGILAAVKCGTVLGRPGQCGGAEGHQHAQFLARHPDDPAVLGAAGLAAGLGPARQPGRDDHAGLRAGQCDCRRADAPHAQRHAAGADVRLRAHRAQQGPARAHGGTQARAAQCADAGHHAGRAGARHPAVGRGVDRPGVLRRGVARRCSGWAW